MFICTLPYLVVAVEEVVNERISWVRTASLPWRYRGG
jgi:hypothetical protein